MKRTLASVFGIGFCVTLLVLTAHRAFAQTEVDSKTKTVAKADSGESDGIVKMNAMAKTDSAVQVQPVVKMSAPKAERLESILPPPDGNELAESCKAEAEGFDAGYCLGVVEGVIASMKLCKKDRSAITLGDAADVTAKYLASHPNKLKDRDVIVARKALSEAYPCGAARR